MFINAHTGLGISEISVRLSEGNNLFIQNGSSSIPMLDVDDVGRRHIFSTYFKHLTPDTLYRLTVLGRG